MKIHKLRFGHATNSSSSHSLIFLDKLPSDDVNGVEFGWDYFTAASRESKLDYFGLLIQNALRDVVPPNYVQAVLSQWVENPEKLEEGYIDHESVYIIPMVRRRSWPEKDTLNEEFIKDLKTYLLQDNLVILGGNDNYGTHPLDTGNSFYLPIPQDARSNRWTARKDEKYGYWVLYERQEGTKIRFSFGAPVRDPHEDEGRWEPTKAFAPELVDVKITSRCPFVGEPCYQYCYQASTPDAKHASREKIQSLASGLGKLGVFEVALGGGEPTFHPDFVGILRDFRSQDITPNFTTRSTHWLKDAEKRNQILPEIGAFALSVNDAKAVEKLMTTWSHEDLGTLFPNIKIAIQYVMGSSSIDTFQSILEACTRYHFRLTLLGYKIHGRGAAIHSNHIYRNPKEIAKMKEGPKAAPYDYSEWLNKVLQHRKKNYIALGIDTALAEEWKKELEIAQVPEQMYETQEGKFSCYIDTVTDQMGPSSYCSKTEMVSLPTETRKWGNQEPYYPADLSEEIKRIFANF